MIFFFPMGVLLSLRFILQGMHYRHIPLISNSTEHVVKVFLSFLFVPLWGYAGASVAGLFSWMLCTLLSLLCYIRIMKEEQIHS